MDVGFQPWTCWSFSWTNLDRVALYILRIYLFWQQSSVLYWTVVYYLSLSCTTAFNLLKKSMWGSNYDHNQFVSSSSSLVGVYVLKMSRIWQQNSMIYLIFGVRFDSVMQHCVQFLWNTMWGSNPEQDNHFRKPIYLFLVGYIY